MKKVYITSPLYYVNAKPHIGHAYTQVICDSIARFAKQSGSPAFFMTGTDEHGEKIEKAALESGFQKGEEKKFVDGAWLDFEKAWKKLNIEYDHFIRTTDKIHEDTVKKVLSLFYEKKEIYKKLYQGWFCTPCEMFWSNKHAPDGACPDCKRDLEKLDEENYFLKISKYQGKLIKHIKKNPSFIIPEIRRNEVLSFLEKNELQDLCISRPKKRLSWGIELPFDKNFVTYVWLDALINYISGIGYLGDRKRFNSLWPCSCHVIGKDILRHHAIYWPIMLFALGEKAPLHIFVHGWWVVKGEKMSKSKGNVTSPMEMINKYGVDAFRYFLLASVQFGYDGAFSEELFVRKYNTDLANDLGNLLNRTLTMLEKYFNGALPGIVPPACDGELEKAAADMTEQRAAIFAGGNSQGTLKIIWNQIARANKYIEDRAPWKLAKENKDALRSVMYNLIQTLGIVAIFLYPFMPETSRKIWAQLGMKSDVGDVKFHAKGKKRLSLWGIVPPGTKACKGSPLFPRIVKK